MKYLINNKNLLIKYLQIFISNIILLILCNFYLKDFFYKDIVLFFLVLIFDLIIYYYKERIIFKLLFDFILSILLGLLIVFFIKDENIYGKCLISIIFANNIVFTRSRLNENFIKRSLQYLSILIFLIIEMFIDIAIYTIVW